MILKRSGPWHPQKGNNLIVCPAAVPPNGPLILANKVPTPLPGHPSGKQMS